MEINKRRKIVVFLAMVLGFVQLFYYGDVKAMAKNKIVGSDDQVQYVQDTEKVDALFDERGELATDFDKNKERIAQIDAELSNLGVDFLSTSEVTQLLTKQNADKSMNIEQPLVALPTVKNVTWTSTRQVTVYRGKEYELQIIRGVPNGDSSPLVRKEIKYTCNKKNFVAGATNVIKVVGISVLGSLPEIGGSITVINTFYDAFKEYDKAIKTTTTINDATVAYSTAVSAHSMYVFVKTKGAKDAGNQIVGYQGNIAYFSTGMTASYFITKNGIAEPTTVQKTVKGYSTAPYYNNVYVELAAKNYYNYKNGSKSIKFNYMQGKYQMTMLGSSAYVTIPSDGAF